MSLNRILAKTMNLNEVKKQRSSYFSSRAFGPFRLGSSTKTLSSPGMITCRPVSLPGLKQKITHTAGSFPFLCFRKLFFREKQTASEQECNRKSSEPEESKGTYKKTIKRRKRMSTNKPPENQSLSNHRFI